MDIDELRALQAPIKERYKENPDSALISTRAEVAFAGEIIACRIPS